MTRIEKTHKPGIWWLASYPKSGNTLLRAFLTAYDAGELVSVNHLIGTQDISHYWNHTVAPRPAKDLELWEEYAIRPAALLHMRENTPDEMTMWVKTHAANVSIEHQRLIPPMLCAGAVYVVRDPRSVAPSFARHMGEPIPDAVRDMQDEWHALSNNHLHQLIGSWAVNVTSWLETSDLYNTCIVRYEDLVGDPEGAFREVVDHCYGEVDEGRLEAAIEASRFENLRSLEDEQGFGEKSDHAERFFRRGSTDWSGELTAGQAKKLEDAFSDVMEHFDYV